MIGLVDDPLDSWKLMLDHLLNALLERNIGSTASLATPHQSDIDLVVLYIDEFYEATVICDSRIDHIFKEFLDFFLHDLSPFMI